MIVNTTSIAPPDPHGVLGVASDATVEDIRAAAAVRVAEVNAARDALLGRRGDGGTVPTRRYGFFSKIPTLVPDTSYINDEKFIEQYRTISSTLNATEMPTSTSETTVDRPVERADGGTAAMGDAASVVATRKPANTDVEPSSSLSDRMFGYALFGAIMVGPFVGDLKYGGLYALGGAVVAVALAYQFKWLIPNRKR